MRTITHQIPSPNEVSRDPFEFARRFLKIQDKSLKTIPLIYNPIQQQYLRNRTARDLILKPRQEGLTTAIQAEIFRYNTTRPDASLTLGKDDQNTKWLRKIYSFYYDNLPPHFRPRKEYDNATMTTYPGIGSTAIIGTAGSVQVGRGGTFRRFHGSEVAFWGDAQSIITGALQAGNLVWVALETTANGAQGWFYERVMECLDKPDKTVWKLHFYRWFDSGQYQLPLLPDEIIIPLDQDGELELLEKFPHITPEQLKWRRAKISEIGNLDDFLQEYPEDPRTCFKRPGMGYFGNIDHAFKLPGGATYDPSHRYVAGLDFGQQNDWTVLLVLDKTTMQFVDIYRQRREEWDAMRLDIRHMCQKWHVAAVVAEKNSIGTVNIREMYKEFHEVSLNTTIIPFDMNFVSKPIVMATFRTAIRESGLLFPTSWDVVKAELNASISKLTQRGWTVESPRDRSKNKQGSSDELGHGDTVVAGALAVKAAGMV